MRGIQLLQSLFLSYNIFKKSFTLFIIFNLNSPNFDLTNPPHPTNSQKFIHSSLKSFIIRTNFCWQFIMAKSRLLSSTLVVSSMTMLSRILGLVRDVVLMGVFGAGGLMDAFLVAFKIPNFLRRLFAEGAFSQAFVPVLTEYKEQKTFNEIQLLISRVSGVLGVILLALTVAVLALAPFVIQLFAPGFVDDPAKFNTATELLYLTFPYLFLFP